LNCFWHTAKMCGQMCICMLIISLILKINTLFTTIFVSSILCIVFVFSCLFLLLSLKSVSVINQRNISTLFKFVFCLCALSVYPICHYFVVSLSSVLMVASIDGHLPLLVACHCSLLLLLKIVNVLTWQINSLSLTEHLMAAWSPIYTADATR